MSGGKAAFGPTVSPRGRHGRAAGLRDACCLPCCAKPVSCAICPPLINPRQAFATSDVALDQRAHDSHAARAGQSRLQRISAG